MRTLFGHDTSPYVRRIRVLLDELALPFARDPSSWNQPDAEVLRRNPMLRVPALSDQIDGQTQWLLDSRIIAEYLFTLPAPRSPAPSGHAPLAGQFLSPTSRWEDANLLAAIDSATDSAINVFLLALDGVTPDKAPYLARQETRVATCLSWIESRLSAGLLLGGDHFAYPDIALYTTLDWMQFRGRYPVEKHPRFVEYLRLHASRPSLASSSPRLAAQAALPVTPR